MEVIEKYFLYRADGTEEIEVEKLDKDMNIVRTLTGAHFSEESKKMTDSDVKRFKGVYGLLYENELGLQTTIFDIYRSDGMELNKIYNEDCLVGMKRISGGSVDLIVTDPPYLINYSRHVKGHRFENKILNDNNPELISKYIKECYRILKNNSAMYMFTSHKTVDFFKQELENTGFNVKNMIIWDKQRQGMGDTSTVFGFQYELIFFVSKGQPKIRGKRLSDIWSFPKVVGRNQVHQNQKPIELIERCVTKHSNEGDVVFDGFMGSGTTAIACINTNRNYIGFELDEEYYETSIKRINNHVEDKQIDLFEVMDN